MRGKVECITCPSSFWSSMESAKRGRKMMGCTGRERTYKCDVSRASIHPELLMCSSCTRWNSAERTDDDRAEKMVVSSTKWVGRETEWRTRIESGSRDDPSWDWSYDWITFSRMMMLSTRFLSFGTATTCVESTLELRRVGVRSWMRRKWEYRTWIDDEKDRVTVILPLSPSSCLWVRSWSRFSALQIRVWFIAFLFPSSSSFLSL